MSQDTESARRQLIARLRFAHETGTAVDTFVGQIGLAVIHRSDAEIAARLLEQGLPAAHNPENPNGS